LWLVKAPNLQTAGQENSDNHTETPQRNNVTITELAPQIRQGQLSPVELTRQTLARIEKLQPVLNAYITVTADLALEQARRAEQEIRAGNYRGPLHGIPYAAKDLFYTKGIRTTVGSKILTDFVPGYDAAVIEKLTAAGAILVGKAGLHEWAFGITSNNPHFGAIRNPWNTERIPGGSSGGSAAALAADLCSFSLGSDTGGSIRIPASFCGLVGLKPTFGRVSRYGVYPLGHTLDHAGPFAWTVEDAALVYEALAGYDARDTSSAAAPLSLPLFPPEARLEGKKIGVPRNFYFENLDPEIDAAVGDAIVALENLGAAIIDVEVPDIDEFNTIAQLILLAEAASVHHRRVEQRPADFGEDVRALLQTGRFILATEYLDAQRRRREFIDAFNRLLAEVDVIVTPAIPIKAARIGQKTVSLGGQEVDARLGTTRFMRALNMAGLPLLSVPCGFDAQGMPIGLQIIGRLFDEAGILEIGHAFERATQWHERRPALG
jgi:aspartyl-tRNA(Asn)/glutamyl-tRNA(Gln) amidotransferase subunit A